MEGAALDDEEFARRLTEPGVVERCELTGAFGFMAYHGGALEERTDVIAAEAAAASSASLYVIEHPGPDPEHIPSTRIRPGESPALAAFLEHVDVVVTIHGYGRWGMFTSLLLGGRNRELAVELGDRLTPALPEYEIVTELDEIPRALRGLHAENPVNLARQRGVQLELPPRVRGLGPRWASWDHGVDGHVPPMAALIDVLAATAVSWQEQREPASPTPSSPAGDGEARRAP